MADWEYRPAAGRIIRRTGSIIHMSQHHTVFSKDLREAAVFPGQTVCWITDAEKEEYRYSFQRSLGIEFDRLLYDASLENVAKSGSAAVSIYHADAELYQLPAEVTRCFFFNPFGEQILRCALNRILDSFYETPREILLFFYYPKDSDAALLMTIDELMFADEISCSDLFPGRDERERILIFEVTG